MKPQIVRLKLKGHKSLEDYIEAKKAAQSEPRTVRASRRIWARVIALAQKHDCSVNEIIVEALIKACDEEGV